MGFTSGSGRATSSTEVAGADAGADRGTDRIIEALKRQLDAKQAVIDAKDAALREKDRTVRVLLGKLAANIPMADSELKKELEGVTQRAEQAERRVKELEDRLFAKRYVRVAAKVDRKW